jgi:hypothetical protein
VIPRYRRKEIGAMLLRAAIRIGSIYFSATHRTPEAAKLKESILSQTEAP